MGTLDISNERCRNCVLLRPIALEPTDVFELLQTKMKGGRV